MSPGPIATVVPREAAGADIVAESEEALTNYSNALSIGLAAWEAVQVGTAESPREGLESAAHWVRVALDTRGLEMTKEHRARLTVLLSEILLFSDDIGGARAAVMRAFSLLEGPPFSELRSKILATARMKLVSVLLAEGKANEAAALYRTCRGGLLRYYPDAEANLTGCDLQLGHWERGLLSLARFASTLSGCDGDWQVEDPESVKTRIARGMARWHILPWGGLGDTLQGLQFAPQLDNIASSVTWHVQPEVLPLQARIGSRHSLVEARHDPGNASFRASGDVVVVGAALPFLLGLDAHSPGLPPALGRPRAPRPIPGRLQVAFNWKGGRQAMYDPQRSTDLGSWLGILSVPGIDWIPVQPHRTPEEERLLGAVGAKDPGPLVSFEDTARVLEQVDLLLSVDSSVGHLGGLLGLPVWLLVAPGQDGRWGRPSSHSSPFYAGHRLWWRTSDWSELLARVSTEVAAVRDERMDAIQSGEAA